MFEIRQQAFLCYGVLTISPKWFSSLRDVLVGRRLTLNPDLSSGFLFKKLHVLEILPSPVFMLAMLGAWAIILLYFEVSSVNSEWSAPEGIYWGHTWLLSLSPTQFSPGYFHELETHWNSPRTSLGVIPFIVWYHNCFNIDGVFFFLLLNYLLLVHVL